MTYYSSHFYAATAYLNAEAPLITNTTIASLPMVPAPVELVGAWEGSNCGLNDPGPVDAELEMAENGVNIWYFAEEETGELLPQTGESFEVIVGYQCIDVGRGYWWGKVPYSDVLWCNLFQVEEVSSDEFTTVLSYTNLAYGGQGVGALATGACPTDLTSLEPSMKPLQASFTKRILTENIPEMTCNVPMGAKERVQPSHNSQFPHETPIPDPFHTESLTSADVKRIRSAANVAEKEVPTTSRVAENRLPIMSQTTCRIEALDEATEEMAFSAGSRSNIDGFAIAAVLVSALTWMMV